MQLLRIATLALMLSLFMCATRDSSIAQRDNPLDAGGENWTQSFEPDSLRVFWSVDTNDDVVWADFNFLDSTGSVLFRFNAIDPDGDYDTLTYTLLFGTSTDSLDTVYIGVDSFYTVDSLQRDTRYQFKLVAEDSWGGSQSSQQTFNTPTGIPPQPPANISTESRVDYIGISWDESPDADFYTVYRSTGLNGFYEIIDTTMQLEYDDYVDDYQFYYFRTSACNEFGQALSSQIVTGIRTNNDITPPYFNITKGVFENKIVLSWNNADYYNVNPPFYDYIILRAMSTAGPFVALDSIIDQHTESFEFNDIEPGFGVYYYQLVIRGDSGGSRLTEVDSGYVIRPDGPTPNASDGTYGAYIELTWNESPEADKYVVFRVTQSYYDQYTAIDTVADTLYRDSTASADSTYYYKIAIFSEEKGTSLAGNWNSGYKIFRPKSVTSSNYSDYVQISWNGNYNDTYAVYRSDDNESFMLLDTVSTTSFRDSSAGYTPAYYAISLRNGSEESELSESVTAGLVPASPDTLIIRDSVDAVYLRWNLTGGAGGYYIYRRTNTWYSSLSNYTLLDSVEREDDTVYYDTLASDSLDYYYFVTAFNQSGVSEGKTVNVAGRYLSIPLVVTAVTASANLAAHIQVQWTPPSMGTVEGYIVYREGSTETAFSIADTVDTTVYFDTTSDTTSYVYKIVAYNIIGQGPESDPTPTAGKRVAPSAPEGLTASDGLYTDTVEVGWNATAGAEEYVVFRKLNSESNYTLRGTVTDTFFFDVVTNDSQYNYLVLAQNFAGQSGSSNIDTGFRAPQIAPGAPSGLSASDQTTYIRLSWSGPAGGAFFNGYKIYRQGPGESSYTMIKDTATTNTTVTFNDSTLFYSCISGSYTYRITCYNVVDESAASLTATACKTGL